MNYQGNKENSYFAGTEKLPNFATPFERNNSLPYSNPNAIHAFNYQRKHSGSIENAGKSSTHGNSAFGSIFGHK